MSILSPLCTNKKYLKNVYLISVIFLVIKVLPLDERQLYPSALVGPEPGSVPYPACIVTGYPVLGLGPGATTAAVQFKRPGCAANKEDWNKLTMAAKMDPSNTELADILKFIGNWCGAVPNFSFV